MGWLKDILEDNRRAVAGWPAWKRGELRKEYMMTREEFLFGISDLLEDGHKALHKMLSGHDVAQRAEIERLTHELHQSNEACVALREGKPLGPIIGAQTILNQAKEIARLREQGKKLASTFLDRMNTYGRWEDGCFYYNRTCASELQEVIAMAKQALEEEHP